MGGTGIHAAGGNALAALQPRSHLPSMRRDCMLQPCPLLPCMRQECQRGRREEGRADWNKCMWGRVLQPIQQGRGEGATAHPAEQGEGCYSPSSRAGGRVLQPVQQGRG